MGLQAQQIVSLACQIAKTPGFTSQAGQFLNTVLQTLAQDHDFDIIRKTYNFNFNTSNTGFTYAAGSGPNPMPSDFLRAHRNGSFYLINNVPYTLIGVKQEEFDTFVQQPGLASYPSRFYVDVAPLSDGDPANLYVWTPAAGAYPCTVRYNPIMPDIATPESSTDVPWFPNTDYLIQAVAARLMMLANDDRYMTFNAKAEADLTAYLKMKDDPETAPKRVTLDRARFGNTLWSRLPNTKSIGWVVLLSASLGSSVGHLLGGMPWI